MNLPKLVQRGSHLRETGWRKEIGFKLFPGHESAGTAVMRANEGLLPAIDGLTVRGFIRFVCHGRVGRANLQGVYHFARPTRPWHTIKSTGR